MLTLQLGCDKSQVRLTHIGVIGGRRVHMIGAIEAAHHDLWLILGPIVGKGTRSDSLRVVIAHVLIT